MYFTKLKISLVSLGVICLAQALSADPLADEALANRIKDRIAPYYGNTSMIVPYIIIRESGDEPAYSEANGIYLHKQLFGYLRDKFPDDSPYQAALAFIISHELAHHYHHYRYMSNFTSIEPELKRRLEAEADQEGFFKASLAGYALTPLLIIDLLDLLYAKFPGADRSAYPNQEARVNATQEIISTIYKKHLPSIFQAASFLYTQNQPVYAAACIKYIYQEQYIHESICNDLGVIYLSAFLAEQSTGLFKYPLSFDVHTIRGSASQVPPFHSPGSLLTEAERYLGFALQRNPHFESALVNLAILYHFKGFTGQAQGLLDQIKASAQPLSPAAHCVQGILDAHTSVDTQPKDKVLRAFGEAAKSGSRVAEFNKLLVEAIPWKEGSFQDAINSLSGFEINSIREKANTDLMIQYPYKNLNFESEKQVIAGLGLQSSQATEDPLVLSREPAFLSVEFAFGNEFNTPYQKLALLYYDFDRRDTREVNLLQVRQSFGGSTGRGIHIGSSYEELLQKYGRPDPEINPNVLGDALYKYNDSQIVFEVKDRRVVGWTWFWELD